MGAYFFYLIKSIICLKNIALQEWYM